MAFLSKGFGTCVSCRQPFGVGEEIKWSRSQKKGKRVWHVVCPPVKFDVPQELPKVQNWDLKEWNEVWLPKEEEKEVKPLENELGVFGPLAQALVPYLEGKLKAQVTTKEVEEIVTQVVSLTLENEKETLGKIVDEKLKSTQALTIKIEHKDGEMVEIKGAHESVPRLLYYVSKGHHVYLYGPPGSGKSTAARMIAKGLKREYGYISLNPQTPDSRLLGFIDANGVYRATPFFKAYTEGHIFCIDELDNASPSLLTTLNSLLENGLGAFPNGIFPRHKDFVLVGTGNTCGKGANPMFPERRPFDSAFAERFTYMLWEYDTKLEKAIALSINPDSVSWFNWILQVREFCQKNHPKVLVSPRATFKGAEYLLDAPLTVEEIATDLIWKGLDKDTVSQITRANVYPTVSKSMKAGA